MLTPQRAPVDLRAVVEEIRESFPGMSGLEALRRLREWLETRGIPVLALSAAATDRDKKRAMEAGFLRHLTRPVRVDELVAELEALLIPEPPGAD